VKVLGFIGGAFDPIHRGHCHLALRALAELPLPEVWLMVNGAPPHRPPPHAPYPMRLAMARLASADLPGVSAPDWEPPQAGGEPRYTIDAVRRLRASGYAPVMIIGGDAFCAIDRWREWQALFSLIHFAVVPRANGEKKTCPAAIAAAEFCEARQTENPADLAADAQTGGGKIYLWDCAPPPISSTAIRRALYAKGDIAKQVPPAVADFIAANRLYEKD
jgi:nicotinate-nucleotide adenylyltransferase